MASKLSISLAILAALADGECGGGHAQVQSLSVRTLMWRGTEVLHMVPRYVIRYQGVSCGMGMWYCDMWY